MVEYVNKIKDVSFDAERLRNDLLEWIDKHPFNDFDQICLTSKPGAEDRLYDGTCDKKHDANITGLAQHEEMGFDDNDYFVINPELRGTYIEEVLMEIRTKFDIRKSKLMLMKHHTCYNWHVDYNNHLHVPIITNAGCRMVVQDKSYEMPANGSLYHVNTLGIPHTFFNGGQESRIHLIMAEYCDRTNATKELFNSRKIKTVFHD